MEARKIIELLAGRGPFVASQVIKDPFQTKLTGDGFTIAIWDEALEIVRADGPVTIDLFVQWVAEKLPLRVSLQAEGDDVIVGLGDTTLRARPSRAGYESMEIWFADPASGLPDCLVL